MERKGGGNGVVEQKAINSKKLLDKELRGRSQTSQKQLHYLPYTSEQHLAKYLLANWFHTSKD